MLFNFYISQEENEARELGLLYTVPSAGLGMGQSGPQTSSGQESPTRSMSERSGSGGGKSANKGESGCDSSASNGYDGGKRGNYQTGQHPQGALPPHCTSGNSDVESSHYRSFINRKSDGMLGSGEPLSPGPNGASKLAGSMSPKSPQLMDSDSDDVGCGDSDHNSHPTGMFCVICSYSSIYSL